MTPAVTPRRELAPLTQRDKTILGVAGVTAGVAVVAVRALVRALRPAPR